MRKTVFLLLPLVLLVACNGFRTIKSVFAPVSPYDQYVESLKKAQLLEAWMTKEWLEAGQQVFDDSVIVQVPFSESGYFQASSPEARSYRFHVRDGQVITVGGAIETQRNAKVFLDLFIRKDEEWKHVAFADSSLSITYEFNRDSDCLLRLQPELLANAYYALSITLTPVLINPVYGASNKSIGSFYGASRDNGKRLHEGIDIFAPKGTPVVAPTDGYISRVGLNRLGGKVVWMKDLKRGHSYYFAHLDSQLVQPGIRVQQGDVLGLVGNTGNARRTPPHLHFGIYQSGSKDPLHYIQQIEAAVATLPVDTGFQQKPFKTRGKKTKLRTGPSEKLAVRSGLPADTYVTVVAQSNEWYRVALPDDKQGFVLKKQLVPFDKGRRVTLDTAKVLLSETQPDAVPVAILEKNTSIEILAHFFTYAYVQTETGKAGWLFQ
jgi:murein DD-endopeptidase MepM/ murein hydrolase activator NlpD